MYKRILKYYFYNNTVIYLEKLTELPIVATECLALSILVPSVLNAKERMI